MATAILFDGRYARTAGPPSARRPLAERVPVEHRVDVLVSDHVVGVAAGHLGQLTKRDLIAVGISGTHLETLSSRLTFFSSTRMRSGVETYEMATAPFRTCMSTVAGTRG